MQTVTDELTLMGQRARESARALARLSGQVRDLALTNVAEALRARREDIQTANDLDCQEARRGGLGEAALGRLTLDQTRLDAMAYDVRSVAALPDPIGETFDMRSMSNGLRVGKRRVPLGVIGAIYESRPNVTIDIAVLCVKSGNAVILRGGKEAVRSNKVLATLVRESFAAAGVPRDAVQLVESTDRALVGRMLEMNEYIDLMVPRGGADLVRRVGAEATMPAVTGGVGVCHLYVDRAAEVDMAVALARDSKVTRPHACNAVDTLLVHSGVAPAFLPLVARELKGAGVEFRCDQRALSILGQVEGIRVIPATDEDWGTEYLSLTVAVRVVDSLDEALEHIDTYGSGHTEAVVSENYSVAMRFLDEVDAGVVLVNAGTVFNDGGQLGLGSEVAISTNKLHARGPMGLRELTSYKWTVLGTGQVRG